MCSSIHPVDVGIEATRCPQGVSGVLWPCGHATIRDRQMIAHGSPVHWSTGAAIAVASSTAIAVRSFTTADCFELIRARAVHRTVNRIRHSVYGADRPWALGPQTTATRLALAVSRVLPLALHGYNHVRNVLFPSAPFGEALPSVRCLENDFDFEARVPLARLRVDRAMPASFVTSDPRRGYCRILRVNDFVAIGISCDNRLLADDAHEEVIAAIFGPKPPRRRARPYIDQRRGVICGWTFTNLLTTKNCPLA